MQEENLKLRSFKVGCLPIIDQFIERIDLHAKLKNVLGNNGYADAVIVLMKNILIDREAMYGIRAWSSQYDGLCEKVINDDRIGRALDRLFETDRASLQTRVVLSAIKMFDIKMDRIHSDTTSISVSGEYADQDSGAVQLKRGHSKDHRPDLKQLVYNLCVSADGAVPVHFKVYDGNQTDDGIQLETWNSLRALLQSPDFIYVADSKLCVEETLRKIDREHGRFVTMVPRTRSETKEFTDANVAGEVRWEKCLRKRSHRHGSEFDTFECAAGLFQLREGFRLYWYRSSQKKKRDAKGRKDRISRTIEKLENLDLNRLRGPKTEGAIKKRIDRVLARYNTQEWLTVDIRFDEKSEFKATTKGKPTIETRYRRMNRKIARLHIRRNEEIIARAKCMDGIFPLATNTKEKSVEVLKIYKYQPQLEKRHSLLKSTLAVAPVWLKKNSRIEALMFVEYLAQTTAALIERELRKQMRETKITLLASLPEGRGSQTPTFEQLLRTFSDRSRHELHDKMKHIRTFAEPLSDVQSKVLALLNVPKDRYLPST